MSKQSEIFTEISDEIRLKIVEILAVQHMSVNQILNKINKSKKGSKITQPNISQHLRRLHSAGLVSKARNGQLFIYSLRKDYIKKQLKSFLKSLGNGKVKPAKIPQKQSRLF